LQDAREIALNTLYKIEIGEGYSNITLNKELTKAKALSKNDKALVSQLVYGVITWKLTLDTIIRRYSSIRLKKISSWIINILRMGIYQICYLDKIPESAAVNESVKLAKKYGHEASAKFVNAILRKIEKNEIEKLLDYIKEQKLTYEEELSITTSHPLWLVEKLLEEFADKDFVKGLLEANNQNPRIALRANRLKITRDNLVKLLIENGVDAESGNLSDSIFIIGYTNLDDSLCVVQDEAAQLSVLKLNPKENDIVLDACSSPGGKTTYIAELMNNKGIVDAWDIHEHRVELVKNACQTQEVTIVNTSVMDASEYNENLKEKYDKILLDVPCSGLGVIRKKPDIKWSRNEEELKDIVVIQKEILNTCSKYLKVGGTLVYSTCTVLKEENENQVEKLL
jgi:16S rRNA (cytosine967-C5)-methyltransferase